ncbi:nuclear transport factor 2 family protein [Shewanella sp. SR44-3]|uniref:YybH family protein n=1 Tax=unclassified Shewanella TaxID=196818 RepID=UPI0015F81810|nr:nuclear transport factor 2 family protein [Shewanella sp. SR44-3]MBB1268830.1 nuclear transport factor 2 family protein [Shewanella sp. SR44-3]
MSIRIAQQAVIAASLLLSTNAYSCDFDCTLNKHLTAIKARDFTAFESTISQQSRLTFILPNGAFFGDASEYRAMLKEWFATSGWHFNYKIISVEKSAEMANALLLVSYDEDDRDGKPYHIDHYLSLLFKKQGDGWYLVHDQNTKIEPKAVDVAKTP